MAKKTHKHTSRHTNSLSLSLPGRECPIYKHFLKATNDNLDDLIPSRWEYRWRTPNQVVAVLAELAAVIHGEGATLGQSERGSIIVTLAAQNNEMV